MVIVEQKLTCTSYICQIPAEKTLKISNEVLKLDPEDDSEEHNSPSLNEAFKRFTNRPEMVRSANIM